MLIIVLSKGEGNMAINRQSVEQIIEAIGGKDNISTATHCVTRLRLVLHDESKVDTKALEDNELVKGSFSANGQFQVVIGQGTVDKVYKMFVEIADIESASKQDVKDAAASKQNFLQRGVKTLADIFIPILPAIVTAGLLLGINNILTAHDIFFSDPLVEVYPQWAALASIINLIASTAFVFLPALIGWSAAKQFGGSPLLGIVLGLILVHPDLLNAWAYGEAEDIPTWNLFGLEIEKIGYQGQVLPVLVSAYILAKIETFLNKRIPDSIQMLIVAPVALLVTGILAFTLIGPVTFWIANLLTDGFIGLFDFAPAIGGLVYGALYAPLVITGMHHTFLAVDLQLIGSTGSTFLWPMLALSNIAQGAAALAMMLITRNEKTKGLAGTSAVSAFLGVTEPALFGVNLRFKFPFFAAIIGSAIAGLVITVSGVEATSIGVGGIPGFLSIYKEYWGAFFTGMGIVLVVPFGLTYLYGKIRKVSE